MKQTIQQLAVRNLMATGVVAAIVVVLMANVIAAQSAGVVNLIFPPRTLDVAQAAADSPLISLTFGPSETAMSAGFYNGAKIYEPTNDLNLLQWHLFNGKYVQNGRYVFSVTPDAAYELGLGYETALYDGFVEIMRELSHQYVLFELDGVLFFAKVPHGVEIADGMTMKGSLVPFPAEVIQFMKAAYVGAEPLENVFAYHLDTTNTFTFEGLGDTLLSLICAGIALWLTISIAVKIVFAEKRPLYKQIAMFGADIEAINSQMPDARRVGRWYITKDWAIAPGLFISRITRNI